MITGKVINEAQYRAIPNDSSSSLKEFSIDRRKYYKRYVLGEKVEEEDSKASIIGRVVETLLFEKEEFDNRFYMSSIAKGPTGNMLLFVESLCRNSVSDPDKGFENRARQAYKDSGYKWTFDKVLEKFSGSDAEIYFNEILSVKSKGLTVVTLDDVTNAERIVEELKTNEFTAPILTLEDSERYSIYVQLKIEEFEVDSLPMKAMMDFVVVDHDEKTIQVYDLKTVWSVENFTNEYFMYRRSYIQAYIYKEACKELKNILELEYYTIENPKFIVCDSISYYAPLIYTVSSENMVDFYNGFDYNGKYYPGVKDIIKDILFAKSENIWNISRNNYICKAHIPVFK